jgi:hypothetical protein
MGGARAEIRKALMYYLFFGAMSDDCYADAGVECREVLKVVFTGLVKRILRGVST